MNAALKPKEDSKPVGIWIRVSTDDQARGESPEHHERRARSYAESKGWRGKELYHLEGVSGKSVIQHPEAQRMLKDVRNGQITGLIFSKLARLARNTKELLDLSDIFREHGADLISLQEAIDTGSPAGRLFFTVVAAMAQWEREEIAERVAASIPIRAKLGKPLGGAAPFGYQWKDKKLVPSPTEAPVRKLMCELFLETKRKLTTARILNERGYRTRRGDKFTVSTVDRLLRDPTAKGQRIMNYTRQEGTTVKVKPESEWVYVDVEPIVSPELWTQVNQLLNEQRDKNKRPGRKVVHLFTGIVYCSCGGKMYVPSNSPKYICWQCRKKIPVDDLEAIYREQLKQYLLSTELVEEHLRDVDGVVKKQQGLLQALLAEKRKHENDIEKLYDLYLSGEIPKEGFGTKYQPLYDRLKELDSEIPRLQGELDFYTIQKISTEEISSEGAELYSRWPHLTPDEKRSLVENITDRITLEDGALSISLRYLPFFLQKNRGDSFTKLPCFVLLPGQRKIASKHKPSARAARNGALEGYPGHNGATALQGIGKRQIRVAVRCQWLAYTRPKRPSRSLWSATGITRVWGASSTPSTPSPGASPRAAMPYTS